MTKNILICTVGGSHQPVLTAIRELSPAHVLFFATGRDPATGRPGSLSMITGKGEPIEDRRGGEVVERLANIPTQAGLTAEQFTTVEVPADDLDGVPSSGKQFCLMLNDAILSAGLLRRVKTVY